jgi:Concanavalin A-like lectin/glucanases superfamily/SdrD B-like domain/FlgD Ig-like domain
MDPASQARPPVVRNSAATEPAFGSHRLVLSKAVPRNPHNSHREISAASADACRSMLLRRGGHRFLVMSFVLAAWIVGGAYPSEAGLLGISESSTTSSILWDINTTTGVPSNPRTVSSAPDAEILCIAFDPAGVLYGVSMGSPGDFPSAGKLYTIDPTTGSTTLVATLTQDVVVEGDIAADPTTGVLYAVDGTGHLFTIDKTNGVCTSVGNLPSEDYSAMGFDSSGKLFIWDSFGPNLLEVNKSNAAIVSTVALSPSPGAEIGGLAFDPITGTAYLAANAGSSARISTVNPISGSVSPVGPLTGLDGIWAISFAPTCPETMLVHYTFDDPANRGKDDSGNNINGTLGAAIPVSGKCGTALRFRPNNNVQEFSVASNPALDISGAMTGSAYIRIRGTESTDYNPGCTEGTIFTKGGNYWFQVERNNDRLVFQNTGSGNETAVGLYPFTLNSWVEVGFVRGAWTGGGQTIQFYVNCQPIPTIVYESGVSTGTNVLHEFAASPNSSPLMVGNYGFGNDPGACEFNGDIDELKIFGRALSAPQVLAMCSCPCPDSLQPCVGQDSLVINTGWDQLTANQIAEGLPDNEWIVTSDPDAATTEPRPAYVIPPYFGGTVWALPTPGSRWISSYPTSNNDLNGLYKFQYRFCLEDTVGALLDVCLRADDLADVYLNGNHLGATGANSFRVSTPNCISVVSTSGSQFTAGENVIEVDVQNTSAVAMGLDLVGAVHGHVPQYEYCCSDTTASLLGKVWHDNNYNGVLDAGEPPLAGWTVHLAGPKTIDAISDALGNYYFSHLPAGSYTVTQTPFAGWSASYPPPDPPATLGSYTLILDNGEAVDQLNFGRLMTDAVANSATSLRVAISQIRPNPLAEQTSISFTTPARGAVRVEIWDIGGRLVADLSPGQMAPGVHTIAWNGRGADGSRVRPGVYMIRLRAAGQTATARLILVY